MAAASADPATHGAQAAVARAADTAHVRVAIARSPAHGLIASVDGKARGLMQSTGGTACVLLVNGTATLVTHAGLGQRANALWMSALALVTMTIVPLLMSGRSRQRTTLATAATLIAAMSAMGVVPAYVNGFEHPNAIATVAIVTGGALLLYWRHLVGATALPPEDFGREWYANKDANRPTRAIHTTGVTVLLALLAGLSSGSLARFQLYAICGMSVAQPIWQIALSLGGVCALALIADRSGDNNRILIVLYVLRAALIGTLAVLDSPPLALIAARIFLVFDCATIPALMKLRDGPRGAMSASCPGAAHHIGMVLGATLSTTPYFFGDGFTILYGLSAITSLTCAGTLATGWFKKGRFVEQVQHARRPADTSDGHEVRVGKYDCLVTPG
jgi:hypothetical protein